VAKKIDKRRPGKGGLFRDRPVECPNTLRRHRWRTMTSKTRQPRQIRQISNDDPVTHMPSHHVEERPELLLKDVWIVSMNEIVAPSPDGHEIRLRPILARQQHLFNDLIDPGARHPKVD